MHSSTAEATISGSRKNQRRYAERFELLEDEPDEEEKAAPCENDPNDSAGLKEARAAGGGKPDIVKWIDERASKHAQSQNPDFRVSADLQENLKRIKMEFDFHINEDIVVRQFKALNQFDAFIVYMDGMVNKA